ISASRSPAARRLMASRRWKSDNLGLRPNLTPFAIARLRPSPVRSRISSRSNSAMAARSVESSRPCGLEVSHSGSPSERNTAPALPTRSIRSRSSRVERPSRSSLVTWTTSLGLSAAMSLQLWAISAHAADLLAVDRGRARGFERLDLAGQVLIRGADASIAKNGHLSLPFHKQDLQRL